jgi:cytochrome c biogenesis protein CcmG/thiol:disulfide interchange protein DsbE
MKQRGARSTIERWMGDGRRWLLISLVIPIGGAAWTWASTVPASRIAGSAVPSPREGFLAPDFTVDRLDGGGITLSDLRGQVVLLNLWASWCPPCRKEMPAIQRVYDEYRGRGLEVVALNTTFQDREQDAGAFYGELGLTFPVGLDRTGEVSRRYLLRALPTTFFVDPSGVIRKVVVGGPMSETLIRTTVDSLLPEDS